MSTRSSAASSHYNEARHKRLRVMEKSVATMRGARPTTRQQQYTAHNTDALPFEPSAEGVTRFSAKRARDDTVAALRAAHWPACAELCLRLFGSNPHARKSPRWNWWNAQAAYNVPLLLSVYVLLKSLCGERRIEKVLLVERDCFRLYPLMARWAADDMPSVQVHYVHASRRCFRGNSASYQRYVAHTIGTTPSDRVLIVDLSGTGTSGHAFWAAFGRPLRYFVYKIGAATQQQQHNVMHAATVSRGLICAEMLNYADVGSVVDVVERESGRFVAVRLPLEYDAELAVHSCDDLFLALQNEGRAVAAQTSVQTAERVLSELGQRMESLAVTRTAAPRLPSLPFVRFTSVHAR